jgi:hypothetical protein
VINRDTNTSRLLSSYTSILQLGKRESPSFTNFPVVSDGLSTNGRPKEGKRADTEGGSFCLAGSSATELAPWLVEPGADSALPVFAEVVGR